ncbi:GerAB/ArcD/ProY family transporter [Priestia abyssalis]|uniref:GerAB/ArcD/ProY family transporter n=1 Tax=Priestia abyssalis TaxID=1221450 RepID=UPI000995DB11|nr:GerAB/ArcD/ProY family transporter [Priestia abyssalis]
MKPQISTLQYALLIANFIFSGSIISLPQLLTSVSEQNSWLLPVIAFPFGLAVIWIGLGKRERVWSHLYSDEGKGTIIRKGWAIIFLIFLVLLFIRDLRALSNFVGSVLLPTTPIPVVTIFSVLTLCYITWSGLEVIARVSGLHFIALAVVTLSLPLMLMNEINLANFQPVLRPERFPDLLQGTFFLLAWVGEIAILLLFAGFVNPAANLKKAASWGVAVGLFFLCIALLLETAVLGPDIVEYSSYPNYILIQEINITDFLDRLDLAILSIWVPTLICKLALSLYGVNCTIGLFMKRRGKMTMIPVYLLLGILSILLFEDNLTHQEFSFYTWASLGLLLELLIIAGYIVIRRIQVKNT